jgi:hypothetical protein
MKSAEYRHGLGERGRIALVVVALASAGGPGCSQSAPEADAGRAIASAFLDEIRQGRVDAAWAGTTAEFKSMLGLEGLRGLVRKNRALREPAEFVAFAPVERDGLKLAEYSFRTAKGKKSAKVVLVKVILAREDGAWKVEWMSLE